MPSIVDFFGEILRTKYKYLAVAAFLVAFGSGGFYVLTEHSLKNTTARTFKFSSSVKAEGPTFHSATVDPSDVKVGDTQLLRVELSDPVGVASVMAVTKLDTHTKEVSLKALSEKEFCTDCTWEGSWTVTDTSKKTYETRLIAINTQGEESEVTVSWTDPCSPPKSGAWTLDGNCQINTTNGLEEGVFTIPSDKTLTLQNGGTWIYQAGYSMNVQGTIAIEEGGKLLRSLLWVPDADSDGYAPDNVQVASLTSPGGGYVRRKNISGFGDCYDANSNVYSGQTSYFTTQRGDGSYDYNCSGGEEKYYPSSSGSCYGCGKYGCSGAPGFYPGGQPSCGETRTYYINSACSTQSLTQSCR